MAETTENIKGFFNPAEKNKGEEPIVIAQRYLNIFRQLHIFDDTRKEAFNQSLLDLPAEIRGMFSNLPGGSVLQEYVNTLERKAGIVRDRTTAPTAASGASGEEISQAKILATALAEAQVQAAAQIQQTAPVMAAGTVSAAPSKIVADGAFAQEIAKALAAAIQHSDDNHRQEYAELIKAINDSQERIAAMLASDRRQVTDSPVPAAPDSSNDGKIETLTKAVTDSQLQMAKMFLQFYNSKLANQEKTSGTEISEAFTKAITDSQMQIAKMFLEQQERYMSNFPVPAAGDHQEPVRVVDNSEAVVKAISESQKELVQLLIQHNTTNQAASSSSNANNIQINTVPNFPPVEDIINGIVKAQSEIFRDVAKNQTKELTAIIGLALKESQQISTQTIVEALKGFHEENLKFWEMHPANTVAVPVYQTATEPAFRSVSAEETPPVSSSENASDELSEIVNETQTKKKKKKKKKKDHTEILKFEAPAHDTAAENWDLSSLDISEENMNFSTEENVPENGMATETFNPNTADDEFRYHPDFPKTEMPDKGVSAQPVQETGLDNSLFDFDTPGDTDLNDIFSDSGEMVSEGMQTDTPALEPEADVSAESKAISAEPDDVLSETEQKAENKPSEEQPKPSWKWAFDAEEKELADTAGDMVDLDSYGNDTQDSEEHKNIWLDDTEEEEKRLTGEDNDELSVSDGEAVPADNSQDWEWEYEEVPENDAGAEEAAQDWEWEYEEVPEDDAETSLAAANSDNSQDWEWEYEEVPEDETSEDSSGEQEWEWEYEEVSEDGSETSPAVSDNTVSQDWEWEYEEVPEDGSSDSNNRLKDPYHPGTAGVYEPSLPNIETGLLSEQPDILNPTVKISEALPHNNDIPPIIPELLNSDTKSEPYLPNSDVK